MLYYTQCSPKIVVHLYKVLMILVVWSTFVWHTCIYLVKCYVVFCWQVWSQDLSNTFFPCVIFLKRNWCMILNRSEDASLFIQAANALVCKSVILSDDHDCFLSGQKTGALIEGRSPWHGTVRTPPKSPEIHGICWVTLGSTEEAPQREMETEV